MQAMSKNYIHHAKRFPMVETEALEKWINHMGKAGNRVISVVASSGSVTQDAMVLCIVGRAYELEAPCRKGDVDYV